MKTTPEIQQAINSLPPVVADALSSISTTAYSAAISPRIPKKDSAALCKEAGYRWLQAILSSFEIGSTNFQLLLKEQVQFFLQIAESNLYLDIAEQRTKGTLTEAQCLEYLELQYKLIAIYATTSQHKELQDATHRLSALVAPIFIAQFGKDRAAELFTNAITKQTNWTNETATEILSNIAEFVSLDKLLAEIKTETSKSEELNTNCHKPYAPKWMLDDYEATLKNLSGKIATFERVATKNQLPDALQEISKFRKKVDSQINELPTLRSDAESWSQLRSQHFGSMRRTRSAPEEAVEPIEPVNPSQRGLKQRKKPRGKSFNI